MSCAYNNQSYYQNPSYSKTHNLGACNNFLGYNAKNGISYSGETKCKGFVNVKTAKNMKERLVIFVQTSIILATAKKQQL